jgi:hypothetical protein
LNCFFFFVPAQGIFASCRPGGWSALQSLAWPRFVALEFNCISNHTNFDVFGWHSSEGGDAATLLASFGEQDDQDDSESDQESGSASGSQSGSESGSEVDERDGESDEELDEELDGEEPLSGDDAQPDEYSDADDAESQPDQMEQ